MQRDEFRKAVFERDKNSCVICGSPAMDAHHIMERRLFEEGGYDLSNGASLCAIHHIQAEQTLISPADLYKACGIAKRLLPPHLYEDYEYTKWGDIENANGTRLKGELFFDESVQKILASAGVLDRYGKYIKYPRTYHLPYSLGRTDDDRSIKDESQFDGQVVVVTLKMDGENTTGYWDGYVHARSLDSGSHPSRDRIKNMLSASLFELPENWRICGENLYAKHSIHYKDLASYFQVFSVWNARNECLGWHDTGVWSALLSLETVKPIYLGVYDKNKIMAAYEPYAKTNEGFVVRLAEQFTYGNFRRSVAKYVRPNHVQTNQHWIRTAMIRNELA